MENFNNKTIFFIGDSITTNGYFIDYLREFFKNKKLDIKVYNKGIPGYRADLFSIICEEDLENTRCDYALINYGCNDIGIWLYDTRKVFTEQMLCEREERIDTYILAIKKDIELLQDRGITPILSSPFCVDETLIERQGIESIKDNEEKKDQLDEGFYKRDTFREINKGLKKMSDAVKEIAKEKGLMFLDFFDYTYKNVDNSCFIEDGTHYTKKGHFLIASLILHRLFNQELKECKISDEVQKIREKEQMERNYLFYKYNILYFEFNKILSDKEIIEISSQRKDENNNYKKILTYLNNRNHF